MKPRIGLVSLGETLANDGFYKLSKRLEFVPVNYTSLQVFFNAINTVDFSLDLILADIDCIETESCTDVFDLLNTMQTLFKINSKRMPAVAVVIHPNTAIEKIKNVMTTDIKGFIWDLDSTQQLDENESAVRELLNNKTYIAREIIDRIKPVKKYTYQKPTKSVNGINLTLRQEQILNLICTRGSSNKAIARLLNLSESTVKLHIGSILKKYGLKNRTQLALFTRNHYAPKKTP